MYKYSQTPNGQYHGPLPVRNFFPLPNAIFDLGLTAEEIAALGEGGLCLNCKVCTWPDCGFGKGC